MKYELTNLILRFCVSIYNKRKTHVRKFRKQNKKYP